MKKKLIAAVAALSLLAGSAGYWVYKQDYIRVGTSFISSEEAAQLNMLLMMAQMEAFAAGKNACNKNT